MSELVVGALGLKDKNVSEVKTSVREGGRVLLGDSKCHDSSVASSCDVDTMLSVEDTEPSGRSFDGG